MRETDSLSAAKRRKIASNFALMFQGAYRQDHRCLKPGYKLFSPVGYVFLKYLILDLYLYSGHVRFACLFLKIQLRCRAPVYINMTGT
jgi:hypothetical protein